jgi:hypothetical protein
MSSGSRRLHDLKLQHTVNRGGKFAVKTYRVFGILSFRKNFLEADTQERNLTIMLT